MFKKLNRTSRAAAMQVRPLIDYLIEQNNLLDEIGRVLARENRAISARNVEDLTAVTERKSQLMLTLQQNDQKIKLHPDAVKLKGEYAQHVHVLKLKLTECKRRNEVNGKLIRLCQASCRRLSAMLMGVRDKLTASMTYTDKGSVNARSPLRVSVQA